MADPALAPGLLSDERTRSASPRCDPCDVSKRGIPIRAKRLLWSILILVLILTACVKDQPTVTAPTELEPTDTPPSITTAAEPAPPTPTTATLRHLTILYTNDEHGWMEATEESGGAAGLMGLWREQEGYTDSGPFLILSGGDMWTGPAISTWFDGESMAEVMNAIGYDAAAIGNHEFDFGLAELRERAAQSEFPFLSANIRDKETGALVDISLPYVIQDVNGVQVGLIGLTTIETPQTTMPDNVAAFDFIPYQEALEEVVPLAREEGAELLVVVGHICADELRELAPTAAALGVAVVTGGHCNERMSTVVDGVALIEGGAHMEAYAKVDLTFDTATDTVLSVKPSTHENSGGAADSEIAALVAGWRVEADEALEHVIGYVDKEIGQRSNAMFNMVTDAWLAAYPAADIAMTNRGGFRQPIPAGEITLATIVGVLPFNNVLVDVELTGAQLIENIQCCRPVVGGMDTMGRYELANGTPIGPDTTYHVLVNDFMYAGGDDFIFDDQDPDAYNTAIDWRQPVIDWIISLNTSPDNPLDGYLDNVPRQR
jgi:5'-nucleotidase/UDP-sugar diphosphatase